MAIKSKYAALALIPVFSVVLAATAQIALPLPNVSLTLQVFGVALCGCFLGAKGGTISTLIYIFLGACGAPVFSHFSGGAGVLLGPGGGFIIGFLPLAFFAGLAAHARKKHIKLLLSAAGLLLCYTLGTLYFAFCSGISVFEALLVTVLPFALKDAVCIYSAHIVAAKIQKTRLT